VPAEVLRRAPPLQCTPDAAAASICFTIADNLAATPLRPSPRRR
jgi:hypothetical protein